MQDHRTPNVTCRHCGSHLYVKPSRVKAFRYCSTSCRQAFARANIESRFWSYVDKSGGPDACWPWTGTIDKGYGVLTIRVGDGRRVIGAHRLSLNLAGVDVPDGMHACHHCDNPQCVNPRHLYAGTPLDNVHDALNRGRHYQALTEDDVRELRRRYVPYKIGYRVLAKEFGVGDMTVRDAIHGITWAHVPMEEES